METGRRVTARAATRLASAAIALAAAGGAVEGQEDALDWQAAMSAGQVLEVRGITGSVRAEPARGRTAEVRAEKHGDRDDFDRVRFVVEETRDGFAICAVYDRTRRGEERCGWRDGRDDHEDDDDRRGRNRSLDVEVEFVVRVPAGVELVAGMVTGDVEAVGLDSDVSASTVTGDVLVSTSGLARASTVSGEIDVEMGSADFDKLAFRSVSGDITLRLPERIDAEVDFQSLSGDLDSDFSIRVERERRRFVGQSLRGTIGEGGGSLSLSTVSGDVRLLRARR